MRRSMEAVYEGEDGDDDGSPTAKRARLQGGEGDDALHSEVRGCGGDAARRAAAPAMT